MSRIVGIEFDGERVSAALLHSSYRKLELVALAKELVSDHESIETALARAVASFGPEPIDHIATSLDGRKVFSHHLEIPGSARKRMDEILGFELEAELPIEIEEIVYDRTILPNDQSENGLVKVLTLAARFDDVQHQLKLFENALSREPEIVCGGAMTLENLQRVYPELNQKKTIALLNIGHDSMDLCALREGSAHFARTLSIKLADFPEVGPRAVALMRQTLSSVASTLSEPVSALFIVGPGLRMGKIDEYLSSQLGMPVSLLAQPSGLESSDPELMGRSGEFAKAIAAALLSHTGHGFDLRQGSLSFQRGYGYLKQRIPLLSALLVAVMLSFLFSTWAEMQALTADYNALIASLEEVSETTFGNKISDADEAETALAQAKSTKPEDPMPYLDGFGVAVVLSEVIPEEVIHDIEELEVSKGKVKLRGLVSSAEDAQTVLKAFESHRCIGEAKVNKISQVVSSRAERKRYILEAVVLCPEDSQPKKSGGSR